MNKLTVKLFDDNKLFTSIGKRISIQNSLVKRNAYPKILNKDNLSALDNYVAHNDASLYITDLGNDMFHSVGVGVFTNESLFMSNKVKFPMKLKETGKDFVETMKTLYVNVENAIKSLKEGQK